MDEALKADVAYWAAFYDHRLKQGNKHIFHLEGQSRRSATLACLWRSHDCTEGC